MSFPFPQNCSLPGQRVSICFQAMERFRLEHNSKPLRGIFASSRLAFDATVPAIYHGLSLKVLNHFWQEVLQGNEGKGWPGIPKEIQEEATSKKDAALGLWKQFDLYQRENLLPRFKVAEDAMLQALKDCEDDAAHDPIDSDFEDLDGKKKLKFKSNKNESTNIAFVRRAIKKYKDRTEGDSFKEAIEDAWIEVKNQARGQAHKAGGTLDPNSYGGYWDIDINEILAGTPFPELPDPPEDLTTYIEIDTAGNRIQNITSLDYDFVSIPRNEEILLYKDKGVGFVSGDIEHLFDFQVDSATNTGSNTVNGWANIIGNRKDVLDASEDGLFLIASQGGTGTKSFGLQEIDGGSGSTDVFSPWVMGTRYYNTFGISGTALSNKIYDDADRTSLVDTLSLTLGINIDLRYHYACMSYDDGGVGVISGNSGNYDFQLAGVQILRRRREGY